MKNLGKKFDVVVMNPPYQAPKVGKTAHKLGGQATLWGKFVHKSLDLCKTGGYIASVHPANWRRPEHEMWTPLASKDMRYLSIHSAEEGNKVFGASTRFDWYVICNQPNGGETLVNDEHGNNVKINLKEWPFLPNFSYEVIRKILASAKEEKCPLLFDTIYHSQKEYVSETEDAKHKWPCVYSMTQDGIGYQYSSKNLGHFGVRKVIISIGRYPYAFNDWEGKYGMTQAAFAIPIKTKEEGDNIVKAVNSEKFGDVIKAIRCNTFNIEYRMFRQFRRDFWKDFI